MSSSIEVSLAVSGVTYGAPLVLAGTGELLSERGGVMNLGVDGMMLVGAASGFWVCRVLPGPSWLALLGSVVAAGVVGALMAALFAVICISWRANQIVAGLAMAIGGGVLGLSSYLGSIGNLGGSAPAHVLNQIDLFGLANLPAVGPLLFHENILVYASWAVTLGAAFYLYRTRWGLFLRAAGEDPAAADAMGVNVVRYRYTHTILGGFLAGVGGATYTLALIPSWTNGMTTGLGFIAIGLVILALWNPILLFGGAFLFGVVINLGYVLETRGVTIPPEFFAALPYVVAIATLVLLRGGARRSGGPQALGRPYSRAG
ncbi:MAG: ABC transporter permease [Acidimicrobiales bacterium]|jgi:simple sugar transport system permease protein